MPKPRLGVGLQVKSSCRMNLMNAGTSRDLNHSDDPPGILGVSVVKLSDTDRTFQASRHNQTLHEAL